MSYYKIRGKEGNIITVLDFSLYKKNYPPRGIDIRASASFLKIKRKKYLEV